MNNPIFSLDKTTAYQRWRDRKLIDYPQSANELSLVLTTPWQLNKEERQTALRILDKTNMLLLQCTKTGLINKVYLREMGQTFGLSRLDENLCADEDGVSTLTVSDQRRANEYIPYTNRPLSWHTDGYYNPPQKRIRAWSLLCAHEAAEGGENALLDHEILYILLRDENPDYIRALMDDEVLTIPANHENGRMIRDACRGPVFSVDPIDGCLHMRFSARTRNIQWKRNALVKEALSFIETLFSSDSTYIFRHRLNPGQCLLSNNVLHNRSAFRDDPAHKRVIYRARYFDRIHLSDGLAKPE